MNWLAILAACSPLPVIGDIGAAMRRSSAQKQAVLPAGAPLRGHVVVPLTRAASLKPDDEASFYVGEISIGQPQQKLKVVFDTSSGHVLLPHRACKSLSCRLHNRYSPWESATSMDISAEGQPVRPDQRLVTGNVSREGVMVEFEQADLGSGVVQSVVVRDHVCIGSEEASRACVDMAVLAAYKMSPLPFQHMPSDGIVGLGLAALASSPLCSFVDRLMDGLTNALPQFGLAFGPEKGELHIGGHDLTRLASPLQWFPVDHPEVGFWQVAIQNVKVGNVTVDACQKGCHGVIDSSVYRLGVQSSKMPALTFALKSVIQTDSGCAGPDITFDLGGMSLTLHAHDYTGRNCKPLLGELDLDEPEFVGVYALGSAIMHHYYAAFDWEGLKVGFAPLANAQSLPIPDSSGDLLLV